jgi:DnaK suppressor protein
MNTERGRELLAAERQRIERALLGLRETESEREHAGEDQASSDKASDLTELVYEEESEGKLDKELAALERAEARLATGTYGRSIESGEAIPDERLKANPLAELTVEEGRRLERSV